MQCENKENTPRCIKEFQTVSKDAFFLTPLLHDLNDVKIDISKK
jgi:hypothetical protein